MESPTPLTESDLLDLDAHWRALNYLAAGQIYLTGNPLLTEELRPEHIKPRLLGHWGTCPGLNLVYTHVNRVISTHGQEAVCVWGPGHGGPSVFAGAWLEGRTGSCIRTSGGTRPGWADCSSSSPFPVGCRAMRRRTCRAPSTRAVSWATRSRMRTVPRWTTRTCWWRA